MNPDIIIKVFPDISKRQINTILKFQNKFDLTIENLKCLNPGCFNIKRWNNKTTGFNNCCSKECTKIMKKHIFELRNNKSKETYFKKTGYSHNSYNPDSIKKRKATCLEKYKVEFASKNETIKNKSKETCLKKYGTDNPMKQEAIKNKIKYNNLLKYGVENPMQSITVKNRHKEYYNNRTHLHQNIKNYKNWNDKEFWEKNFIDDKKNFNYIKCMEYFNCGLAATHQHIHLLQIPYIKLGGTSFKERMIYPILDKLNILYIKNSRSIIPPLELDIYLPKLNLAIEYNGIYYHSYHSDQNKNRSPKQGDLEFCKYRHQIKSITCYNKGIRLLHIYEDLKTIDQLIINFIDNDYNKDQKEYFLDLGIYPLNADVEIIAPENRVVLKDRILWNAGKIRVNNYE
jgi:hypothetical protein